MGVFKLVFVLTTTVVVISSLPLRTRLKEEPLLSDLLNFDYENLKIQDKHIDDVIHKSNKVLGVENGRQFKNVDISSRNNIRNGMVVSNYDVKLTPNLNDGTFTGLAKMSVRVTEGTIDDPIIFHFEDLTIGVVREASGSTPTEVSDVTVDDGTLEIKIDPPLSLYSFEIEYSGTLGGAGIGLYGGSYEAETYVAMNLYPTNARRVFPCIDEPDAQTSISFTFAGLNGYNHITSNSKRMETQPDANEIQFQPLTHTPPLWGMIAHNLNAANLPTSNVIVYSRPGRNTLDQQSNVAISSYFNFYNNFTAKPYDTIIDNQQGELHIMAVPDVDRDWYALSTICVWEPYILIEMSASAKQKQIGFVKIAEAMARQWFGFVMVPANWRHQWIITGLGGYSAYEAARRLESNPEEPARIDMEAVFVSDVIQESLLYDSYTNAMPLEPKADLFNEDDIRNNINGLSKTKAPAIMRMMSLVLSQDPDIDYIRKAASSLLNSRALSNVNSRNFYDTLASVWNQATPLITDVLEFMEPWILNNNYPVIRVDLRQGNGVIVTQERFGFASRPQMNFRIPLSFTTRVNPNFNNIYPTQIMETTATIPMELGDDDWVLFNIQGQGYYRVNYEDALWERIIASLEDEDQREQIHPINRATLLDDALNLARSGRLDYAIAFRIVLTLNLETEYVVWKAFARSMSMVRNHLMALVDDNDDLDQDIYLRIIRRIMMTAETNMTFSPDLSLNEPAMRSLSRGLVMDIACRADYQPCVAAAVDWFRDPNDNTALNLNIPADLRPAVYCTNIMTGGEAERAILKDRLENVNNEYERVVILEALACSKDGDFIRSYLEETVAVNSPYNSEENARIFKAVIESSFQNARIALSFLIQNTAQIRNSFGGPEKLEEILNIMSRNIANGDMVTDFTNWVNSLHSNLDTSLLIAERLRDQIQQDLAWSRSHLDNIYNWIDENDAPTLMVSMFLICISLIMALFNH